MAKKVLTLIKLQIPAGAANPAPPVGPALGQHGVNIMEFCKAFNARTQQDAGTIIPVEITVYEDRSFDFITKTPPAAVLIREALGIQKGSGEPNREKVGRLTNAQVPRDRRAQDARPERQRPRRRVEDHRRHGALDGRRRRRDRGLMARTAASATARRSSRSTAPSTTRPPRRSPWSRRPPRRKFDETVEVHIRLGVNVRHAEEQLRGTLALPHGLGKDVIVAVFAEGDAARAADRGRGRPRRRRTTSPTEVEEGWTDFDVAIATPALMGPVVSKLGRVLGPQGKMPNPKVGTVTDDVAKAVTEAKAGKVEYRTDRQGIIHLTIGKASFAERALLENYAAMIDEIVRAKPAAAKGRYLLSITLATDDGPRRPRRHHPHPRVRDPRRRPDGQTAPRPRSRRPPEPAAA